MCVCVCVCVCVCEWDLVLNNLQGFICHKKPANQPINQLVNLNISMVCISQKLGTHYLRKKKYFRIIIIVIKS